MFLFHHANKDIPIIILRTCVRGKVIGSVIVVAVMGTKNHQILKIGVGQSALCHQMVESHKNYLTCMFASNHLGWPTSTTNYAFSLAMPIEHTYQCYVLFPLRMLNLKMGKGRRVIKPIIHTTHYTAHCSLPREQG